jgi:hypothetical protein
MFDSRIPDDTPREEVGAPLKGDETFSILNMSHSQGKRRAITDTIFSHLHLETLHTLFAGNTVNSEAKTPESGNRPFYGFSTKTQEGMPRKYRLHVCGQVRYCDKKVFHNSQFLLKK